ncbi:MAG: hypothetical protein AAF514_12115 [Verrucomicrobiota bacterium]
MTEHLWDTEFSQLFTRCLDRYREGDTDLQNYYTKEDLAFLFSIGYKPREFFDFVEDFADEGKPSPTTAVLIASVRRDFFHTIQKGELSENELMPEDLPARDADLEGFVWLPRIIAKAEAKLRGELNPEIMFCCGGDRAFLTRHHVHPADFLRVTWAARGNHEAIANYVKAHTPQ